LHASHLLLFSCIFFSHDPATTEIYTLSYTTLFRSHVGPEVAPQHRVGEAVADPAGEPERDRPPGTCGAVPGQDAQHQADARGERSEEHTSELQSRENLVCRLLLEKKKKKHKKHKIH